HSWAPEVADTRDFPGASARTSCGARVAARGALTPVIAGAAGRAPARAGCAMAEPAPTAAASASTIVEAIFFTIGPLSASFPTVCQSLANGAPRMATAECHPRLGALADAWVSIPASFNATLDGEHNRHVGLATED